MTASEAIDASYDEITHMNFVFLNFLGDTVDTRSTGRFHKTGLYAGKQDNKSTQVRDFIGLMQQKHISLDQTMVCWDEMFQPFKGDTNRVLKPVVSWLPAQICSPVSPTKRLMAARRTNLPIGRVSPICSACWLLLDNGILLVPGTDGGEAGGGRRPMRFTLSSVFMRAGRYPRQPGAERSLHVQFARWITELQDKYGQIRPGVEADFILIGSDPIKNIEDIRRVEWVVKNKERSIIRKGYLHQGVEILLLRASWSPSLWTG